VVDWKLVNWGSGSFLVGYQIVFLIALPLYLVYYTPHWGMLLATAIMAAVTMMAITTGYHRYYAHRSYSTNKGVEVVLLVSGLLAFQMGALDWAHDHRLHHRYVDTEKDPYNIKKGFWHAHFLWLMKKREAFHPEVVADLMQNKLVVLQQRFFLPLLIIVNLSVVLLFGFLFGDMLGAFVFIFLTRLFISHHLTFFINSLAHYWGSKPYSTEHSAVNNWVIALLTFGEGYHNFHHTFSSDYRNGTRWYQWDPTKLLIWSLHKLGLAKQLIRVNSLTIKKKLLREDRRILLDFIKKRKYVGWVEKKINQSYDKITKSFLEVSALVHEYHEMRKNKVKKKHLENIRLKIKKLKRSLRIDLRAWAKLSRQTRSLAFAKVQSR